MSKQYQTQKEKWVKQGKLKAKEEFEKMIQETFICSSYPNKEIGFTCEDEDCITCNDKKELLTKIKEMGK